MVVDTQVEIFSQNDKLLHRFMTREFNKAARKNNLDDYIWKKLKKSESQFDAYILDPHGEYVTLDDDYLEDYKPFGAEIMASTTVEPTATLKPLIKLKIVLKDTQDHNFHFVPDQQHDLVLKRTNQTGIQDYEQTQHVAHAVSNLKPLERPTIRLSKDPKMGFVDGHNVNYVQGDRYVSDCYNVRKEQMKGKLSMTQGEKGNTNQSVLPRFKIWHDGIKNSFAHIWTLLVYMVLDEYHLGKRSLFYHPGRIFVNKDNTIDLLNPFEIPITTEDWMGAMGMELRLQVVAVEGAKKHPSASLNLLCHVEDIDASELSGSSDNYTKSRWALVLCKDNDIQWATKSMTHKVKNILDDPTNTISTRRRSKKRQTTSNQQSKRQKISKEEDSSSTINSFINNYTFLSPSSQILPTNCGDDDFRATTPETMSNIPAVHSRVVLDSTGAESLYIDPPRMTSSYKDSNETLDLLTDIIENENQHEDLTTTENSMNTTNMLSNDRDFASVMNMHDIELIHTDLLLSDAAFPNADSPNS